MDLVHNQKGKRTGDLGPLAFLRSVCASERIAAAVELRALTARLYAGCTTTSTSNPAGKVREEVLHPKQDSPMLLYTSLMGSFIKRRRRYMAAYKIRAEIAIRRVKSPPRTACRHAGDTAWLFGGVREPGHGVDQLGRHVGEHHLAAPRNLVSFELRCKDGQDVTVAAPRRDRRHD